MTGRTGRTAILDQALDLAAQGLPVFPVGDNKRPTTEKGFHDASTDPAAVARLFANPLARHIGFPTGAVSGIDVLDIDPAGAEWMREHGDKLGDTRTHRTRRDGFHRLYLHREGLRCSAGQIAPGIDVRGDGGYAVWWPASGTAVFRDIPPAPWSPWMLDTLAARSAGASAPKAPQNPGDLAPPDAESTLSLLRAMPNPARIEHSDYVAICLSIQGAIRGGLALDRITEDQADAIKDEAAAWAARWDGPNASPLEREREKWDSDWSTRDNDVSGWRNLVSWAARLGADVRAHDLGIAQAELPALPPEPEAPAVQPTRAIRLLTPEDCDAQPGRAYVVKGLLSEGDLACIFGPPGAGKSIVAPHIGYAVAQGRAAFRMRAKAGPVFYIAAEDAHGMRQRTRALRLVNGDAPDFLLVEGVTNLADSGQLSEVRRLVRTHRPKLVFLDTVALAFPGIDENGSADMGRVVAVGRLLAECGAAVVLIHHDTKSGSGTPRGHSILNGALDVALHVTRDETTKAVSGRLTKNRNGPCDLTLAFSIRSERIGFDEDGDTVTAPVAVEMTAEAVRASGAKLAGAASAALLILKEMAEPGAGVLEKDWRAACDDRRISTSEDSKNRDRVFRRAFQELIGRKLALPRAGYVFLPAASAVCDVGIDALVGAGGRTGPDSIFDTQTANFVH